VKIIKHKRKAETDEVVTNLLQLSQCEFAFIVIFISFEKLCTLNYDFF